MPLSDNVTKQLEIDFARLDELVQPRRLEGGEAEKVTVVERLGEVVEIPATLVSISPLGAVLTTEVHHKIEEGDEIVTKINLTSQTVFVRHVVFKKAGTADGPAGYILRLVSDQSPRKENEERRGDGRWLCDEQFYPTAMAANPGIYNDYLYFSFRDISKKGARAITSLRNKFIVKGMKLNCSLSLPMVAQLNLVATVKNTSLHSEDGKDYLAVGFEFETLSKAEETAIAQYIIQFSRNASITNLKENDLTPNSLSKAVVYSFVRTAEELREVGRLRAAAYGHEGKNASELMTDEFDTRSKIVIGRYNEKIVASCRIFFPQPNEQLEQEQYVVIPSSLGRRDQTTEIMRVCTHADFRRSDLLLSMFRFLAITCIQAGRPLVIGCAEPKLLKIYTDIGFRDTDITYVHPELGNTTHKLIIVDARECVQGLGVNPIAWNVVWRGTAEYLSDSDAMEKSPQASIRMGLYRLLWPVGRLVQSRMNKPRKSRGRRHDNANTAAKDSN